MRVAIFGATGAVGSECLAQSLAAGHEVTVLVRSAAKLAPELRERVTLVEGDGLDAAAVERVLTGAEGVLFGVGVVKDSPEDLCTDITRNILEAMPRLGVRRFVWCGGGSTLVPEDTVTFGAKFVEWFSRNLMSKKHRDKQHQLALLNGHLDIEWLGVRPLQMKTGPQREYRVGFDSFSGMSSIHFVDCAREMLVMLNEDRWMHKAPIVQY
jgi:putative NADH-flavin reductase